MNNEIKSLVLDGNEIFDFTNEVLKYTNIDDIEFRNCDFLNQDLLKLSNSKHYNRISFIDCTFENANLIKNIKTKSLSLTNNKITSYEFIYEMNYLENLTIVGGNIDIKKINHLKNIEYLRLSHSYIINIEELFLEKLKYLFIDNTNILDISFIQRLPKLELLSISEEQQLYNQNYINTIKKNIKIILDSIIEMEVFDNE